MSSAKICSAGNRNECSENRWHSNTKESGIPPNEQRRQWLKQKSGSKMNKQLFVVQL